MSKVQHNRAGGWQAIFGRQRTAHTNKRWLSGQMTSRAIELVIFALLLPIAGLVFFSSDPTGMNSGFAWIIAPPLVFAARYGSVWGIGCAGLAALFLTLPFTAYEASGTANIVLGVGMCILCLLVGEATTDLKKRHGKAEAENAYLRHRLDIFSTDYHVLKVSHGQLEEYMAGQKLSLREALQQLTPLLSSGPEGVRAGQDLMAVFAQFCSVQIAGLYSIENDGRLQSKAIATHGEMCDLPVFDPLLRLAIDKKQLVSIKRDMLTDRHQPQSLLAVVPIVDNKAHVHGVLAIKDMHFMAFQQDNLNLLALLGSYLGNLLTQSHSLEQSPKARFISELETTVGFAAHGNVPSVLISMQFEPSKLGREIADFVCAGIRSLDCSIVLENSSEHYAIGLILPLMTESSAMAFRKRLHSGVEEEFSVPLDHVMQDVQLKYISASDTLRSCRSFFAVHASNDALIVDDLQKGVQGFA